MPVTRSKAKLVETANSAGSSRDGNKPKGRVISKQDSQATNRGMTNSFESGIYAGSNTTVSQRSSPCRGVEVKVTKNKKKGVGRPKIVKPVIDDANEVIEKKKDEREKMSGNCLNMLSTKGEWYTSTSNVLAQSDSYLKNKQKIVTDHFNRTRGYWKGMEMTAVNKTPIVRAIKKAARKKSVEGIEKSINSEASLCVLRRQPGRSVKKILDSNSIMKTQGDGPTNFELTSKKTHKMYEKQNKLKNNSPEKVERQARGKRALSSEKDITTFQLVTPSSFEFGAEPIVTPAHKKIILNPSNMASVDVQLVSRENHVAHPSLSAVMETTEEIDYNISTSHSKGKNPLSKILLVSKSYTSISETGTIALDSEIRPSETLASPIMDFGLQTTNNTAILSRTVQISFVDSPIPLTNSTQIRQSDIEVVSLIGTTFQEELQSPQNAHRIENSSVVESVDQENSVVSATYVKTPISGKIIPDIQSAPHCMPNGLGNCTYIKLKPSQLQEPCSPRSINITSTLNDETFIKSPINRPLNEMNVEEGDKTFTLYNQNTNMNAAFTTAPRVLGLTEKNSNVEKVSPYSIQANTIGILNQVQKATGKESELTCTSRIENIVGNRIYCQDKTTNRIGTFTSKDNLTEQSFISCDSTEESFGDANSTLGGGNYVETCPILVETAYLTAYGEKSLLQGTNVVEETIVSESMANVSNYSESSVDTSNFSDQSLPSAPKEKYKQILNEPVTDINESLYVAGVLEDESQESSEQDSEISYSSSNNNYEISRIEEIIDEQNTHRTNKPVPMWAREDLFLEGQLYLTNPLLINYLMPGRNSNLTSWNTYTVHENLIDISFPSCSNFFKLFPGAEPPNNVRK